MQAVEKRETRTPTQTRPIWTSLPQTKDNSNDTDESVGRAVSKSGVTLLGAGRGCAGWCGVGSAWVSDFANALVLALDDAACTLLAGKDSTVGGEVASGLNVEGTTIVLESWEGNAMILLVVAGRQRGVCKLTG